MATMRRFLILAISRNILVPQQLKTKAQISPKLSAAFSTAPRQYSSYRSSQVVGDLSEYPEVEVVHNPPEWKFVERLLPPTTVPKPIAKTAYPSGWRPPAEVDSERQKYTVARTKNHMVPVYLQTRFRGLRRITVVRLVQGDIWMLEQDLRAVVEKARNGRVCATRVNEMSGQIHIHGDYVDVVREYLKERGF